MFNFDKLSSLASNPAAFEAERARLIKEALDAVPEDKRQAAQAFQQDLDRARASMQPTDFMNEIARRLQENLLDLTDQLSNLSDCALALGADPDAKLSSPPTQRNKVVYAGQGFNLAQKCDIIVPK